MPRRPPMLWARPCCPSWPCSPACGSSKASMPELRTIDADDDGARLDRWFKRHYPHVTHVLLEKLLRKGEVRLDGKRAKAADRLIAGQAMRLPPQVIHAKAPQKQKPEAEPKHLLASKDMGSLADRI